jgi:hypothetical protein
VVLGVVAREVVLENGVPELIDGACLPQQTSLVCLLKETH